MESRSRASPEQFAALIDYMERHGDISNPRQGAQGRIKSDRLWLKLTELLNCIGSGVIKSLDRWKKVWTDWKTKTKKKGLAIHRAASGTGGGPGSRQTLTALEERVLGVMGLSAVVGQAVIEERGFDDPPSETISVPPHTRDFTDAEDIILNSITTHFIEDPHSQEIITSTFERIEKELCVKFFNTPFNYSATDNDKILYVANPDKRKNCPPESYDYEGSVVNMPIGYKCLNERDVSRIVIDMLRASIERVDKPNSNDLLRQFQEQNEDSNTATLLAPSDRNFINAHYHSECGDLILKPVETRRSYGDKLEITALNHGHYDNKIWPLGIIMYGVDDDKVDSPEFAMLQHAMTVIELSSCVVFQHVAPAYRYDLEPRNMIWFGAGGEEVPFLGLMKGNQTIKLDAMVHGAPGHNAHTLNMLMRILGVPMMSNRYDRDNYVTINWKHVAKSQEHYLERTPLGAWLQHPDETEGSAYDFDSVTHAPANFMCADCSLGAQTVQPLQDHLWQRTLTMGHRTDLSPGDIEILKLLYNGECSNRFKNN